MVSSSLFIYSDVFKSNCFVFRNSLPKFVKVFLNHPIIMNFNNAVKEIVTLLCIFCFQYDYDFRVERET